MDEVKFLKWFYHVLFLGGALIMIGYVIYYAFIISDYKYYIDAILLISLILGIFVFPVLFADYILWATKGEVEKAEKEVIENA